jgi:signal peptidase II
MKKYRFLYLAIIIVILDQLTKWLIISTVSLGQQFHLLPGIGIQYITNTGATFGILQNQNLVLAILTAAVVFGIVYYAKEFQKHPFLRISAGLIFGGGVGNLIDRLVHQHVIDFIAIGWWPRFNIADSAITIGIILLLIYFIWYEKK